jgi:peptidyl-prolyl cis-trans isomerase NIMA-interacting 1
MALAMRKHAISAALLGSLTLYGCQFFTAGETVSEPDPAAVQKAAAQPAAAPSEGKAEAAHAKTKEPAPVAPPAAEQGETATASHILIRYAGAMRTTAEVTRTKDEAKKLAEQVASKVKARGADWVALADQYTEDPSGKGRGGKLGTFPKGRMVPEFDQPLFALKPGETSGVVESPFGFHIIYREN